MGEWEGREFEEDEEWSRYIFGLLFTNINGYRGSLNQSCLHSTTFTTIITPNRFSNKSWVILEELSRIQPW